MVSSIAMANIMNQYSKCRGGSLTNRWMAGHNVEVSSQLIILGIRQIKLSWAISKTKIRWQSVITTFRVNAMFFSFPSEGLSSCIFWRKQYSKYRLIGKLIINVQKRHNIYSKSQIEIAFNCFLNCWWWWWWRFTRFGKIRQADNEPQKQTQPELIKWIAVISIISGLQSKNRTHWGESQTELVNIWEYFFIVELFIHITRGFCVTLQNWSWGL